MLYNTQILHHLVRDRLRTLSARIEQLGSDASLTAGLIAEQKELRLLQEMLGDTAGQEEVPPGRLYGTWHQPA